MNNKSNKIVSSLTSKKSPNVDKSCPKVIPLEKFKILTPLKNYQNIWAIWAKYLLPLALKSCPKCNKSPNLVTLMVSDINESSSR